MKSPFDVGTRVRCQRVFWRWRQTPGTVIEVDPYFGVVKIKFDTGVTRWVSATIVEPAP